MRRRTTIALGLALAVAAQAVEPPLPAKINFNRDIRPIFSSTCFKCHGPDAKKRKADLRLDIREEAIADRKGVFAIVPRDPATSDAVRRIKTADPDDHMPPPDSNLKLSEREIQLIERWIQQGAEYQLHWAYIMPRRPEVPKTKDRRWARTPIDSFILSTLEERGIKPSTEADKRVLLRRLSLDLIGLPPTTQELDAFLKDKSDKAYERQVDRLLASPHFGERMAAPWLDVVRYADSVGYHGDQGQNIFPYRDYVIDSFNANKPFDQFTTEQLAGDLLPNPTEEQRIATGFNRLNMMTREGGAQPKEYLAKHQADRVRTVAMTWLGSTMGCCECHDHKYDPFSTKDFYSMSAFFGDVKQWGVYQDYGYTPNPELRGWSNDHPFPPEIEVENAALKRREAQLRQQIAKLAADAATQWKADADERAAFNGWRQTSLAFLQQNPSGWATPPVEILTPEPQDPAAPAEAAVMPEGTVIFTGKAMAKAQLKLPLASGWLTAIRFELLPQTQHNGSIIRGGGTSTAVKFAATLATAGGKETKLKFFFADADRKQPNYFNGSELVGIMGAWTTSAKEPKATHTAVWLLDKPIQIKEPSSLLLAFDPNAIGCLRVSVSPFAVEPPLRAFDAAPLRKALEADSQRLAPADRELLQTAYLRATAWDGSAYGDYKKIYRETMECRNGRAMTMVTVAAAPMVTRVLPRGNWQDESGEVVQPAPPHFLPQPKVEGRLTRLDLAKWLVAPENPLTARVFVNRLWKQFFGNGLSGVVDDLGAQGEWPSHPDLLDWLAVEFRESGWNVKKMTKLIVMSSTYRQSAKLRPELRDVDPNNRLLASQNPRRLDAEFVRDNALAIAGLLNPDLGGPSARPYQPAGYYSQLQFPDRDYITQKDERQYRRGVYMWWQRTFLHPMLANFDAPSREECVGYRILSNTPLQALTLLNDPSFVEAARVFAQSLLANPKMNDDQRFEQIFQRALARPAKAKEIASLKKFLAEQRAYYKATPDDAEKLLGVGLAPMPEKADEAELAAWATVCRVVLNLHETITRY